MLRAKPPSILIFRFQNGAIEPGARIVQIRSNSSSRFGKIDFSSTVKQCLSKSASIDSMDELDLEPSFAMQPLPPLEGLPHSSSKRERLLLSPKAIGSSSNTVSRQRSRRNADLGCQDPL